MSECKFCGSDPTVFAETIVTLKRKIKELEAQTKAANHKPHCNYWKWNWKYSWSDSDCTCYAIKGESDA